MSVKYVPEIEQPDAPPVETKVRRSGGWFTREWHRVRLALAGSDEELMVENKTQVSWRVYHDYHLLGIIDAGEYLVFRLHKRGSLNVRPSAGKEQVEYLVLPLSAQVRRVYIYRRRLNSEIEVYDMRAA
jgi:hypothetical protein